MTGPARRRDDSPTSSPRYPRLGWLPYLLLAVLVGVWALTHVGAVTSGATSVRAWGFAIGAGGLATALIVGVSRLTRRGWAGQLAGLLPLLAASVVAVLPSYLPSEVNEAAPDGLLIVESATEPAGQPATTPPPTSDAATESATPPPTSTSAPPAPTRTNAPPATTGTSTPPAATSTTAEEAAEPTVPVQLAVADFVGIDHDVSGTASLIRLAEGGLLVRFEGFSVEPGPDYDVYVSSGGNVQQPEGTHLGNLKGTQGDQNYELPDGAVSESGTVTVLIWCELFDVPVANATFTL